MPLKVNKKLSPQNPSICSNSNRVINLAIGVINLKIGVIHLIGVIPKS